MFFSILFLFICCQGFSVTSLMYSEAAAVLQHAEHHMNREIKPSDMGEGDFKDILLPEDFDIVPWVIVSNSITQYCRLVRLLLHIVITLFSDVLLVLICSFSFYSTFMTCKNGGNSLFSIKLTVLHTILVPKWHLGFGHPLSSTVSFTVCALAYFCTLIWFLKNLLFICA